jgi:hypothetical protein
MARKPDRATEKLDLIIQILDDLAKNAGKENQCSSFLCQRLNDFDRPHTTRKSLQNLLDYLDELNYGVTNSLQAKRLLERRISLNKYQLSD